MPVQYKATIFGGSLALSLTTPFKQPPAQAEPKSDDQNGLESKRAQVEVFELRRREKALILEVKKLREANAQLQARLSDVEAARVANYVNTAQTHAPPATNYKFVTADSELTPTQLQARARVRAEARARHSKRLQRVQEARVEVVQKGLAARGSVQGSLDHFTTGRKVTTAVVVARGVVADPSKAAFEIIPLASASSPCFVFTDSTVNALYGDAFVRGFEKLGYKLHRIVLPDGEDAKTLAVYAELADRVLSLGIDKHSVLLSLGGGAVANVCGFLASTLHRGLGLVHFPTTLLAQCDASISHKQAVNAPHGKNLVGSYYAPLRIVVDPDVLATLEDWLLPDGMGEIVKHALCQDESLLEFLESYEGEMSDPDFLEEVLRRTIKLKCDVIDLDPLEQREGAVLIYGHTAGHPIETASHRPGAQCCLSHGQSVAIGCVVEARVGAALGTCAPSFVARTIAVCEKYHLPTQMPPDLTVDLIMAKMPFNKTWTAEGTYMTLPERAGKLYNVDGEWLLPVGDAVVAQALRDTMAPPGTAIRGSGSSGFLRRSRLTASPEAAADQEPGAGWARRRGKTVCRCGASGEDFGASGSSALSQLCSC